MINQLPAPVPDANHSPPLQTLSLENRKPEKTLPSISKFGRGVLSNQQKATNTSAVKILQQKN